MDSDLWLPTHRPLVVFAAFAALSLSSTAAAQSGLCGTPALPSPTERPSVAADTLVGTYRCSEEGLTITLRLDANGRFEQRMQSDTASPDAIERADDEAAGRIGRWRVDGNRLYLFERPSRAPEIALIESRRDPAVRMRVEVREPDGRGARDLFIGEGPDANPQAQLDNGVLEVPLSYSWKPGLRQIVRQVDDLRLTSFAVVAGGPNAFRFVYRPSEVEPFETRAYVMDAQGQAIGIPLGTSGAILRRVAPPN